MMERVRMERHESALVFLMASVNWTVESCKKFGKRKVVGNAGGVYIALQEGIDIAGKQWIVKLVVDP